MATTDKDVETASRWEPRALTLDVAEVKTVDVVVLPSRWEGHREELR